jgi:hypothetical protein
MGINRWIGRAPAVRAEAYFVPRSVAAGVEFQLADGETKFRYRYPADPPLEDETDYDRATRVVDNIVNTVTGGGLSGGLSGDSVSVEASNYNGEPAVKVLGNALGQPVSMIATATNPDTNTIRVYQLQEGTPGKDFTFFIKWPNTPTRGLWCMVANGREPVFLQWNATASQVRSAILSFQLPCVSVVVTGDYQNGYTVRLTELLEAISDLPISFPFIPPMSEYYGPAPMLGVDRNAGYTIKQIGGAGNQMQTLTMPPLDGNPGSLYQLEYNGKRSHKFRGVASQAQVEDAARSVLGQRNVTASAAKAGEGFELNISHELAERAILMTLHKIGGESTALTSVDGDTPAEPLVTKYEFTGGVCGGRWRIVDTSSPVGSSWISWTQVNAWTAANLLGYIEDANSLYNGILTAANITVVNELIAPNENILREFTITWPARYLRSPSQIHWFSLDTSELLVCRPNVSIINRGKTAAFEVQEVSVENDPTSGTWTLRYGDQLSNELPYNATAAVVKTAVQAITGDTVTVLGANGGPYTIRFSSNQPKLRLVGESVSLAIESEATFSRYDIVSGTGPSHADNADNWSERRLPNSTDTVVFQGGSPCTFGLLLPVAPRQIDAYRVTGSQIGLPEIRQDGSQETLPRFLEFAAATAQTTQIRIGLGDTGEGASVIRIGMRNQRFDAVVNYTQVGLNSRTFGLIGTHSENRVTMISGDMALGVYPEDVCVVRSLSVVPDGDGGEGASVITGPECSIGRLLMTSGAVSLGKPAKTAVVSGGSLSVNGSGDCERIEIAASRVRWLAEGKLGVSKQADSIFFGSGFLGFADVPSSVRIVSENHGLLGGDRVYIRAYAGVIGLDGKVFSVVIVDPNTFDLVGSAAYGAYEGFVGQVMWAKERPIVVREGGVLDFDSDGRSRDIVPPIVIQGTGTVADNKGTIRDLRLWPEQVPSLAFFGSDVELRRSLREQQ